jgi:hypothetical protein
LSNFPTLLPRLIPVATSRFRRASARAVALQQIQHIVTNLEPRRLRPAPEADRGAPHARSDGMMLSSGRGKALEIMYQRGGAKAQEYRDDLTQQGANIAGMQRPVLIGELVTPLTHDQLRDFVVTAASDPGFVGSGAGVGRC